MRLLKVTLGVVGIVAGAFWVVTLAAQLLPTPLHLGLQFSDPIVQALAGYMAGCLGTMTLTQGLIDSAQRSHRL
jgi:hypothetical protein